MDWKQFFVDMRKRKSSNNLFSVVLLDENDWFQRTQECEVSLLESEKEELPAEKKQLIEAINEYAVKKELIQDPLTIEPKKTNTIKIELNKPAHVISSGQSSHEFIDDFKTIEGYLNRKETGVCYTVLEEERRSLCDLKDVSKVKVTFVGDTYVAGVTEEEDLLGKMIFAMNLQDQDFRRFYYEESFSDEEYLFSLLSELSFIKPDIIVPLGAKAAMMLLQKNDRLSKIHGKFFPIKITGKSQPTHWESEVCPVFHPDFLRINPSMKRTTWIDLQKIMKRLSKEA